MESQCINTYCIYFKQKKDKNKQCGMCKIEKDCIGITCVYFKQNKGKKDFCDANFEQCKKYKKQTLEES